MTTEPWNPSTAILSDEHRACLGLGSNVDPVKYLRRAIGSLRQTVAIDAVSTAWESPAIGGDGPNYVNAALLVHTPRSKDWLQATLKEIENELGRVRTLGRPAQLTIDIDMLIFDRELLEDDLWNAAHRALPVAELLPDLCSPSTGEPVSHAASRLAGTSLITPRPEILAGITQTKTFRTNPPSPTRTQFP